MYTCSDLKTGTFFGSMSFQSAFIHMTQCTGMSNPMIEHTSCLRSLKANGVAWDTMFVLSYAADIRQYTQTN